MLWSLVCLHFGPLLVSSIVSNLKTLNLIVTVQCRHLPAWNILLNETGMTRMKCSDSTYPIAVPKCTLVCKRKLHWGRTILRTRYPSVHCVQPMLGSRAMAVLHIWSGTLTAFQRTYVSLLPGRNEHQHLKPPQNIHLSNTSGNARPLLLLCRCTNRR